MHDTCTITVENAVQQKTPFNTNLTCSYRYKIKFGNIVIRIKYIAGITRAYDIDIEWVYIPSRFLKVSQFLKEAIPYRLW